MGDNELRLWIRFLRTLNAIFHSFMSFQILVFEIYDSSMKSVRIRSFYDPYFCTFALNTDRYGVSLTIQSKCGKIQTRKIPNTDTFHEASKQRPLTQTKLMVTIR